MKRVFFLLIGLLILAVSCQDDFVEPENALTTKSAKYEKNKTFQVKGYVEAIPNIDMPFVSCTPPEYEVALPGSGWVAGHKNIFGKFVQDESFFNRDFCEFSLTPEGPVVYSHANVELTRSDGDKIFVDSHTWVNVATGVITGYNEIVDGTGRFEGVCGKSDIVNGVLNPETGISTWEEDGYITLVLK
jgi:hypothetical protein